MSKKIVRLTESDIERLVKRIIKEEESIDEGLGKTLASAALGATLAFGGMGSAKAQQNPNTQNKIEYSQEKTSDNKGQKEIKSVTRDIGEQAIANMIKSMKENESVGFSTSQDISLGYQKATQHAKSEYIRRHNLETASIGAEEVEKKVIGIKEMVKDKDGNDIVKKDKDGNDIIKYYLTIVKIKINN